jgi:hypothetical protein
MGCGNAGWAASTCAGARRVDDFHATLLSMKKQRRIGATETFSVSIDPQTKAILRARARRLYGGNMSALITDLGREVEKRDAFERIREWAGGSLLRDEDRARIDAELEDGWKHARRHVKKTRKRSVA